MNKEFNLEEAENFIDNVYQHKFDDMEETLEDGTQVIHIDGLDHIKFTDFESASFTLLSGEQRLKRQAQKQKEVIDKVNKCIRDFLCSEEYTAVDGIAIANNYKDILNILKEVS